MDHSLSSSMAKPASPHDDDDDDDDDEESGWTSYLEDFSSPNPTVSSSSSFIFINGGGSSSLVSDAASRAASRFSVSRHKSNHLPSSFASNNKKLTFKKTRTQQISDEDDPLEDTATSPLNSPKVADFIPAETIITDQNQLCDSTGKEFATDHNSELKKDDNQNKDEMHVSGKKNIDYTDLKKKGLCLVPLSMLVNYFG